MTVRVDGVAVVVLVTVWVMVGPGTSVSTVSGPQAVTSPMKMRNEDPRMAPHFTQPAPRFVGVAVGDEAGSG